MKSKASVRFVFKSIAINTRSAATVQKIEDMFSAVRLVKLNALDRIKTKDVDKETDLANPIDTHVEDAVNSLTKAECRLALKQLTTGLLTRESSEYIFGKKVKEAATGDIMQYPMSYTEPTSGARRLTVYGRIDPVEFPKIARREKRKASEYTLAIKDRFNRVAAAIGVPRLP